MDRRTFIATGAWLSSGVFTPAWLALAAEATQRASAASGRCTLAIFDASLTDAELFAGHTARLSIPSFDIGDDIGALWHTELSPRAANHAVLLLGVTRAADFFVLSRLAQRPGRVPQHRMLPNEASRLQRSGAVSFVMPL
ncbi:MAG TPA: hypothetical protein VNE00_28545 [Paraburkholderia sp.]|nr:hypothetical protein [Paraburkholderia sp.]